MPFGDTEGDSAWISRYIEHPTHSTIDLICENTGYSFQAIVQRLAKMGHLVRYERYSNTHLEGTRLSDYPEIAAEFVPDEYCNDAQELIVTRIRNGTPRTWQCISGHRWPERTWTRLKRQLSCPICKSSRESTNYTLTPREGYHFAQERNGDLQLSHLASRSDSGAWWRCFENDDHYWFAPATNVLGLQTGCSCCSGDTVVPSNSLATIFPAIAADVCPNEDYPLTPEQVTSKCDTELWFVCPHCEQGSPARVSNRTILGEGCRFCNGGHTSPINCMLVNRPDLAAEWHPTMNGPITPADIRAGADYHAWWLCSDSDCGMHWQASCNSRSSQGRGCPYCGGQVPRPGESFGDVRLELMEEWDFDENDVDPFTLTPTSGRDVHWICRRNNEHRWVSAIGNRVAGRSNCPACRIHGISIIQNKIAFEIGHFFNVDHNLRVIRYIDKGQTIIIRPDIVLQDEMIIIEFDGSYWHSDQIDRDIEGSRRRVAAGYRVLRLREHPLENFEVDDVTCVGAPRKVDAKSASNIILNSLTNPPFNLTITGLDDYIRQDNLQCEVQSTAYWNELLNLNGIDSSE